MILFIKMEIKKEGTLSVLTNLLNHPLYQNFKCHFVYFTFIYEGLPSISFFKDSYLLH
jgi:hypothetical protein